MTKPRSALQTLSRTPAGRYGQMGVGWVLIGVAPIVGPPAPGPLGIIMIAAGLTLILRNSTAARRRYVRFKRRYPKTGKWVDVGLRRNRPKRKSATADTEPALEPAPTNP